MMSSRPFAVATIASVVALSACGGSDSDSTDASVPATQAQPAAAEAAAGITVVSPQDAAATIADAPDDLVILDVRTQEEFDEAHIEGAVLLDFYRADFADELATFDPDVPYVLYCRSGNRSSQARAIMADLGFTSVDDVDGGIVSWIDAGLPVVSG